MIMNTSISQLIRTNKTYRITSDIQTGGSQGMITLDTHLLSLFNQGQITADQAMTKSQDSVAMREKLIEVGAQL